MAFLQKDFPIVKTDQVSSMLKMKSPQGFNQKKGRRMFVGIGMFLPSTRFLEEDHPPGVQKRSRFFLKEPVPKV